MILQPAASRSAPFRKHLHCHFLTCHIDLSQIIWRYGGCGCGAESPFNRCYFRGLCRAGLLSVNHTRSPRFEPMHDHHYTPRMLPVDRPQRTCDGNLRSIGNYIPPSSYIAESMKVKLTSKKALASTHLSRPLTLQ